MCDVLLNVAFNFMHDLIFTNSSSHEIKVTVEIMISEICEVFSH